MARKHTRVIGTKFQVFKGFNDKAHFYYHGNTKPPCCHGYRYIYI